MAESFAALQGDFLKFAHEIIWCSLTTVDAAGRPRARIVHPIWEVIEERPVGWIFTGKTPIKSKHLAANSNVAFSYWAPTQDVVLGEATASWVEDPETKRRVWDLFMNTPSPLGYDLRAFGVDGPESEVFTPLRLDPHRVQVLGGDQFPGNLTPRIAHL